MTRQNKQTVKCNRDLADHNNQLRKAMKKGEETLGRIRQEKTKTEQAKHTKRIVAVPPAEELAQSRQPDIPIKEEQPDPEPEPTPQPEPQPAVQISVGDYMATRYNGLVYVALVDKINTEFHAANNQ